MSNLNVMYMSRSNEWATPQSFFDELDREFHFNLDPCATDQNHKCERYFTKENDGLSQNWGGAGFSVILRMAGILQSGLRNPSGKAARITRL